MILVASFGSVIFLPFISSGNKKYGSDICVLIIRSSKGRLVQIPLPRGKKFNPQIASNKLDFPADYSPNTAILGKDIYSCKLKSRSLSIKLIIDLILR